ncbi:hypothetical protein DSECCO2_453430 [anaerobic digester metagenome]
MNKPLSVNFDCPSHIVRYTAHIGSPNQLTGQIKFSDKNVHASVGYQLFNSRTRIEISRIGKCAGNINIACTIGVDTVAPVGCQTTDS